MDSFFLILFYGFIILHYFLKKNIGFMVIFNFFSNSLS
jgi:hypothetical protein